MKVIYIRKKYLYIILLIIFILIISLSIIFRNKSIPTTNTLISNKIIGIDPGHGGIDPGAVSKSGVEEAEINLKIALHLKKMIDKNGGSIIITRKTQDGLYTEKSTTLNEKKKEDLENRKKIIEEEKCDIFLTIHLNSFEDARYYGAQTFYKKDCYESMDLADCIQEELRNILDENNNRVPQERDDVYLLRELNIPAVLVECGFLSNFQEEKLLQSENYQKKVALGIYNGIIRYFNEIEKNQSLTVDNPCG